MQDSIDDICYFAAYFHQDKIVFIPSETIESFEGLELFMVLRNMVAI